MQKLGLYYKDSYINSRAGRELGLESGTVVDLKKKAGRVRLLDHIDDRLGICIVGGGINIDTRQQVIKDCIFADSRVPEGFWNEKLPEEERGGKRGLASDRQRRQKINRQIASSPTDAKLKKCMEEVRKSGVVEWNGEEHTFVPPISINNPAKGDRTSWKVDVVDGVCHYILRTSKRKAVLCPLVTGMPVKLAAWHDKYGFVSKTLGQYMEMEVPVLVGLLRRTGYVDGHKEGAEGRAEPFDFTQSTDDDRDDLATLVHKTYSTLNICLWGDNADLGPHSHAAFLWHVVYYPRGNGGVAPPLKSPRCRIFTCFVVLVPGERISPDVSSV